MGEPRLTPIERVIAGQPIDRRRRWDQRQAQAGFKRVMLWVPAERVELLKELKAQLTRNEDFEALLDFVTCPYRAMLDDPQADELDREMARSVLARLGASPAERSALEDARP